MQAADSLVAFGGRDFKSGTKTNAGAVPGICPRHKPKRVSMGFSTHGMFFGDPFRNASRGLLSVPIRGKY
jgi:hypothetical protein